VVIIATTTRFADVAADIEAAVVAGSNVLVSAEECAYPFAIDEELANRLDALAVARDVSICGCGVNPGFVFDALVLTVLGATDSGCEIAVSRTVDLSDFGHSVLRRIGIGLGADQFRAAVQNGDIFGHAGFPQSMHLVAFALGLNIDTIDKQLEPIVADAPVQTRSKFPIACGQSVGVEQIYTAYVNGKAWFRCRFLGHAALNQTKLAALDRIELCREGVLERFVEIRPGINPQMGSQNMIANSIERIIAARSGWVNVASLMPAYPSPTLCG
jgi:4-hydroxy-tetrahydrodipicolinate reductase